MEFNKEDPTKGGLYGLHNGYLIYFRDRKKLKVHRFIAERFILRRKLTKGEVVHHINGNRKDNRIKNLQIMTVEEHATLHHAGKKYKKRSNKNQKWKTELKTK